VQNDWLPSGMGFAHAATARADNPVYGVERDVSAGFVHETIRGVLAWRDNFETRQKGR
jgi:hypothetical protein